MKNAKLFLVAALLLLSVTTIGAQVMPQDISIPMEMHLQIDTGAVHAITEAAKDAHWDRLHILSPYADMEQYLQQNNLFFEGEIGDLCVPREDKTLVLLFAEGGSVHHFAKISEDAQAIFQMIADHANQTVFSRDALWELASLT